MWTSGTVPQEWQTQVVVPSLRRGAKRVCSNYQEVTLLSLPGKVYCRVLEKRVWLIVEPQIEEDQCGFHPGRQTVDIVFILFKVLEGAWECDQPVHMGFYGPGEGLQLCGLRNPLGDTSGVQSEWPFRVRVNGVNG